MKVMVVLLLLLGVMVMAVEEQQRRGRRRDAGSPGSLPPSSPRVIWCPSNMTEASSTYMLKVLLGWVTTCGLYEALTMPP